MNLRREHIDLEPSLSYPFHVLATHYNFEGNPYSDSDDALTLILFHALGVHKETWEVTIASIFNLCSSGASQAKIRDILSIESPNHGRSSEINANEIARQAVDNWPREYAKAAQRFLTARPLIGGSRVDLKTRKLVGICHSLGAAALFLAAQADPTIPFKFMIAFEPGVTDKDNSQRIRANFAASAWAWLRPDVFRSRKAARKALERDMMYATWDPRCLDLFVEHALIAHPAAKHQAPFTFPGVITALSRDHHARSFMSDDLTFHGVEAYAAMTQRIPVYLVWGAVDEFANDDLRDFMTKPGRTPASVSKIEDAGHMVIQQQPEKCAEEILSILLIESKRMARL
ncbi:Alpha/beta hydrolase fold-1 [Mycena albidolilacea]|uniref:Alpha/beta hydrolase fold-1 n=1 Tax=Mycena albidolilacea TaxID=1033008 RepID=A0AAD7EKB9_9AGAR|nr:Alpha/beta hydrolase fold-1 [Mycena albidolilacea]